MIDLRQYVALPKVLSTVYGIVEVVRRNVSDPGTVNRIVAEIQALAGASPNTGARAPAGVLTPPSLPRMPSVPDGSPDS
jgi:hypothetical protein